MKPYIIYGVLNKQRKKKRIENVRVNENLALMILLKINQDKDGGSRQILMGFNITTLQLLMSKILRWIKSLMKITKLVLCK